MFDAELRSAVVDYLGKSGYLTQGFVGDGPVRMGFVQAGEDEQDTVVGLKVIRSDTFLECEIVAVKIFNQNSVDNYSSATLFAQRIFANKCVLAGPFAYDADDREVAAQMGVGLLEIQGNLVKEVVPAKFMKSRLISIPKDKHAGLDLVEKLLEFSEDDWGHLARVFCRADDAWCSFNVGGGVSVQLTKNVCVLEVDLSALAGPLREWGSYSFLFGELAGFLLDGNDDRYTFVEKLGNMFVFRPSDWNFILNLLSKVDKCHLVFYIGTARIVFVKHPCQDGLNLKVDFVDGRENDYEHHYSQEDLAKLTKQKKKERDEDKI